MQPGAGGPADGRLLQATPAGADRRLPVTRVADSIVAQAVQQKFHHDLLEHAIACLARTKSIAALLIVEALAR